LPSPPYSVTSYRCGRCSSLARLTNFSGHTFKQFGYEVRILIREYNRVAYRRESHGRDRFAKKPNSNFETDCLKLCLFVPADKTALPPKLFRLFGVLDGI
jgi:hypothetical protein